MIALFNLLLSLNALACDCVPREIQDHFAAADIIATAKVRNLTDTKAELETIQMWKGGKLKEFSVNANDSLPCGFKFTLGEKYLVFAKKEKNSYVTNLCSGNRPLNDAGKDILWMKMRNLKK